MLLRVRAGPAATAGMAGESTPGGRILPAAARSHAAGRELGRQATRGRLAPVAWSTT